MNQPLVSCIMPIRNREAFVPAAVDCFLKQTYSNKELIILDDSDVSSSVELCSAWPVKHVLVTQMPIGTKRNYCCELAQGEIICHFDSDDWSTPDRISDQVARLTRTGKPVTGYGTLLFWDAIMQQAKRFKSSVDGYVCGTTLCYRKDYWTDHRFEDKGQAEDNAFVYPALKSIAASSDSSHMVARIHKGNTSTKDGISEIVYRDLIPAGFWDNETLVGAHS
jgi:O-antigen biosynthesis protein